MEALRILWLNWRDITNPEAGGAEIYTHEVAKRLVKAGHEVTLVSSAFCGSKKEEEIEGIRVIRVGTKYTVYLKAWQYYYSNRDYDIIIEGVNTIPFAAPIFAKSKPRIVIIYQINKELQFSIFPFPLGILMFAGEHFLYSYYASSANSIYIVLSRSTKEELMKFVKYEASITIAEPGVDYEYYSAGSDERRSSFPFILYLNRIVPYKNPNHLIRAFSLVKRRIPEARLYIGGCRGTRYESYLREFAHSLGIQDSVVFYGYLSDKAKRYYLQKAWVHVLPSMKEGWGISVIEAASCGTPTVAYDVSGLRDSVRNQETGVLVPFGNTEALAEAMVEVLDDKELWSAMSTRARQWARNFSWSRTTSIIQDAIRNSLECNSLASSLRE